MSDARPRRTSLRRRTLLLGAPAVFAARRSAADESRPDWDAFRDRYVRPDGRVVDTGNGDVSHTEGQGWGLLFAEYFDDVATFDRVLDWTSRVLRRPNDALHAWRYRPGDAHPVADANNATDGDLFIAWALARAARRWGAADHARAAAAIARDVLRLLTVRLDGELLLLPAASGFERPATIVVNPSYYVFPALAQLAPLAPSADWAALQRHGRWLIEQGRFGTWMLPPDWLQVTRADGALSPARPWPPRCSYDAIRVPLYLAWAGLPAPVFGAFAAFYSPRDGTPPPAWVDLETGAGAGYPASPGMLAVARMAAAINMNADGPLDFPRVDEAPDYYAAALTLLARIAWQERRAT
jgi:endoglucanase